MSEEYLANEDAAVEKINTNIKNLEEDPLQVQMTLIRKLMTVVLIVLQDEILEQTLLH